MHTTVQVHKDIPKCNGEEIEISIPTIMALMRGTPQVANLIALWLRASTESFSTIPKGMLDLVQPYWALDTPRTMQSPLMEEWRNRS